MTAKRAIKRPNPTPTHCEAYAISGVLQPCDEQVITNLFNKVVNGTVAITYYAGPKTSSDPEIQELLDQEFSSYANATVHALGINKICGQTDHVTIYAAGYKDYVAVVQQPGSYPGYAVVVLRYRY